MPLAPYSQANPFTRQPIRPMGRRRRIAPPQALLQQLAGGGQFGEMVPGALPLTPAAPQLGLPGTGAGAGGLPQLPQIDGPQGEGMGGGLYDGAIDLFSPNGQQQAMPILDLPRGNYGGYGPGPGMNKRRIGSNPLGNIGPTFTKNPFGTSRPRFGMVGSMQDVSTAAPLAPR